MILVMPESMSIERHKLLAGYGTELVLPSTGERYLSTELRARDDSTEMQ